MKPYIKIKIIYVILFFLINSICINSSMGSNIDQSETNNINCLFRSISKTDLPDYYSWKDYQGKDWTTPAKDQSQFGNCGSCWAFAPLACLESVIKIRENYSEFNPDLSEQYVISCLSAGNIKGYGCFGGYSNEVFKYIMDTTSEGNNCNGVVTEEYFPYCSTFLHYVPCSEIRDGWEDHLVPISDWGVKILNNSDEERLWIKSIIMEKGPVVANIQVPLFLYTLDLPILSPLHKWGYSNHDPNAYFPAGRPFISFAGHVVSIVGWKDDTSIANGGYWICKNSWGYDWGYNGFANIEYGSMNIDKTIFPFNSFIAWVDYDPDSYKWPFEN